MLDGRDSHAFGGIGLFGDTRRLRFYHQLDLNARCGAFRTQLGNRRSWEMGYKEVRWSVAALP